MENGLITTYKYDEYGYYDGDVTTQVFNGAALMPPMCIKKAPELKEGYFYKINDNEDGWIAEEKPTCAKECLNIVVDHEDNSHRAVELKKLMQDFCEKDAEHYRVKRDEDLSWSVEAIPPKTFEEVKTEKMQELQSKSASFESNLNKDMYFTSSLGFKCNGDRRTKDNLQDLIAYFDAQAKTVDYRDYDNEIRQLTIEQLETLIKEHTENLQSLYSQKWQLESKVNHATSLEELRLISLDFAMSNFA